MNLQNLVRNLSETELLASGVTLSFRVVQLSRANKQTCYFSLDYVTLETTLIKSLASF